MSSLTPEGRRLVRELATRHGFGEDAVEHLLAAVATGDGRMAQFSHPEFGGSGQWMAGGMLMLGDMFNHALKGRVAALCGELADALDKVDALGVDESSSMTTQVQRQGGAGTESDSPPASPLFTRSASSAWWPEGLGTPSATGSQGSSRYAWFPASRRLALDLGGEIRVHDTLDHRIGGFSQQQGGAGKVSMSSQYGTIDLSALPVVSTGSAGTPVSSVSPVETRSEPPTDAPVTSARPVADQERSPTGTADPASSTEDDPISLIERLGRLHEQGVLTDEEFSTKKRELLDRL